MKRGFVKEKAILRPYATHHYTDGHVPLPASVSQGAASTPGGAVCANVVRIFMGEHAKAVIHDRSDGMVIYTLQLAADGLKVHCGSTDTARLMNVK